MDSSEQPITIIGKDYKVINNHLKENFVKDKEEIFVEFSKVGFFHHLKNILRFSVYHICFFSILSFFTKLTQFHLFTQFLILNIHIADTLLCS